MRRSKWGGAEEVISDMLWEQGAKSTVHRRRTLTSLNCPPNYQNSERLRFHLLLDAHWEDHCMRAYLPTSCLPLMNLGPLSFRCSFLLFPPLPRSGMLATRRTEYAGDVSRSPPAVPLAQQWPRLRLRCVCHLRPILTVSPPSIAAYPPPIQPATRGIQRHPPLCQPSPSQSEIFGG